MDVTETLVGIGDLENRWIYTKQGIHKLAGRPDFPKPVGVVNGRTRIWRLADIVEYEKDRPELHSEKAKRLKIVGYIRAINKGDRLSS